MTATLSQLHIIVSGRVQGVFFRASTRQIATKLDLAGWVKNLPDGRVEIVAEGSPKNLETFLAWCQHGPERAQVTHLESKWLPTSNSFTVFDIL